MNKNIILCFMVLFMTSAVLTAQAFDWQWVEQGGGLIDDQGWGISVDAAGNSYVTGYFQYSATFGAFTLTAEAASKDIFVAKYDAAGNCLWAKQAGGNGWDMGYGISIDAAGNSYVVGAFDAIAYFGPFTLTTINAYDIFVAKLDSHGNWQWVTQAGGIDYDFSYDISVDASGNVYIGGLFKGTLTLGSTMLTSVFDWDIFAAKLDTDGNWLWANSAGGIGSNQCTSISVDANGNSYVTGMFTHTVFFGTDSLYTTGTIGYYETFVAKLDAHGDWLWQKQIAGTLLDQGWGISVDASGNSYVAGLFKGRGFFGADSLVSIGDGSDIYVTKLDTDGNWLWATQAGGLDYDYGWDICVDTNDNPYVTGYFKDTAYFGTSTLTSFGAEDIYVAKLDTAGNWLWVEQAGGSSLDEAKSISLDANGNPYVTGIFQYTATFGAFTLTSLGSYDVFLAKIAEPTLNPPENVNIEIIDNGNNVKITWVNEGLEYNIYSDEDPNGSFGTLEATVTNVGEAIIPVVGSKKFYRVTANN